jgi:hypothetical protein
MAGYLEKSYHTYNVCFDFLSATLPWNISHSKKNSSTLLSWMYIGLHVKYPLLLSDFIETWFFLMDFQKIIKYKILWKSVQWELSCSVQTGRQTGRYDETSSHCSQRCEPAKNEHSFYISFHDFSSLEFFFFFLLVRWKTSYAGSTALYSTTQGYVKMVYEYLILSV